jgi:hypothetical protein
MEGILDSGEWEQKTGLQTPTLFVESPTLSGRVIAALYNSNRDSKSNDKGIDTSKFDGKTAVVAEVAKAFGIVDPVSGVTPPSIRSLKFLIPSLVLSQVLYL